MAVLRKMAWATGGLAATLLVAHLIEPFVPGESLIIMLCACILFALLGGLFLGLLSAVVLSMAQNYYFQLPDRSWGVHSRQDALELVLFLLIACLISIVGSRLRGIRLEAQKQRDEARQATQSRESILAIVSHDLKNPVTSIRLNAQTARKHYASNPELLLRLMGSIEASCDQMTELIRSLLDFEKIRAGTLTVERSEMPARDLLERARELMQAICLSRSQRLVTEEVAPDLVVSCDREQILQVLSNLIGNASKFSPPGSTITLSVNAANRPSEPVISVSDQGSGMSPEEQGHVFDRYWQASEARKQGTGLGLAIVKGIVEAHGGKIWLESEKGRGSRFFFTLGDGSGRGSRLGSAPRARLG
jgi:signal transduction histidine kinase